VETQDTTEEGKRLLTLLELSLSTDLDIRALGMPSKLPFKVATLRELSLHPGGGARCFLLQRLDQGPRKRAG
jgi:hypothetical protein